MIGGWFGIWVQPARDELGERGSGRVFVLPSVSMKPLKFRPHPWHGLSPGPRFPEIVHAYIELTPTDGVKYEIDKMSGYLKVDRPQRFSNFCPTLYGFVPRTYCGELVAAYKIAGAPLVDRGDNDPLDICILTDRPVSR